MAITDPIADMLARIRNAIQAQHASVKIPASNLKRSIADRLHEEGFVGSVSFEEDGKQGCITVELKYDENGESVVDGLERLSSPGRRVYVGSNEIPQKRNGFGTVILSTSAGVITDSKARELGVGGEVLCSVW